MAKIRVDVLDPVYSGQTITFKSPANCSWVTGLKVYYKDGTQQKSKEFQFADAHGNNVGGNDLFAANVLVKVILDTDQSRAYVQNADTNAYLEKKFSDKADKVKSAIAGNLAALTADGELADSGKTVEEIIAQASMAGLKVETGSYIGTGKTTTPPIEDVVSKSLTFNGTPCLVYVSVDNNSHDGTQAGKSGFLIMTPNTSAYAITFGHTSTDMRRCSMMVTVSGTTITWKPFITNPSTYDMMDVKNLVYNYTAICI